ncbi:MAG: cellulase family glycosylhydrolase, partial [Huintestinicola sp.]
MKIKKLLAFVISAVMIMSVTGCAASKKSFKDAGSLSAAEVAKNMGIGINLGNTMEAYDATNCEKITYEWMPTVGSNTPKDYETRWGAVVTTQEVIDGIKTAGFNTVRIPVY